MWPHQTLNRGAMGPHFTAARSILRRPVMLVPADIPAPHGWVPEAIDAFLDRSRVRFTVPRLAPLWADFDDEEPTVQFSVPLGVAVDAPEPHHFRRTTAA